MSENFLVCDKYILVVVAYADDAESFCGGTIAKTLQASMRVHLCGGILQGRSNGIVDLKTVRIRIVIRGLACKD